MTENSAEELDSIFVFLRGVFKYCSVITLLPLSSFFIVKQFLNAVLNLEPVLVNIYSGVAAFIILNISLGIFLYNAWTVIDKPESKKDEAKTE